MESYPSPILFNFPDGFPVLKRVYLYLLIKICYFVIALAEMYFTDFWMMDPWKRIVWLEGVDERLGECRKLDPVG